MDLERAIEIFLNNYEDQWDLCHTITDRGMLYGRFLGKNRDKYGYLFNEPYPSHISQIPDGIREEYVKFIKLEMMEFWGYKSIDELEECYSLEEAAEQYVDSFYLDVEVDINEYMGN